MSYNLPVIDEIDIGTVIYGKGAELITKNKSYLDMFCDNGVVSLGYDYKVEDLSHMPGMLNDVYRDEASKRLCEQSGLDYAFYSNSGTESVEAMMKFARKYQSDKGRSDLYFQKGAFHGRTYGTMSADFTGKSYHLDGYQPMLPGIKEFEKISDIDKDAAAVIITPAEVYGDFKRYDEKFISELVDYCDENDILLGIDEVQTYLRTGEWFGFELYKKEFQPDMIALAKGVAGGLPTGVTLVSSEIGDSISKGGHYSTFGGNRKSCKGIIDVHELGNFLKDKVKNDGEYLKQKLRELGCKNVRGEGLILAFDVENPLELRDKCLENNVILGIFSSSQPVKLTPPLTISRNNINRFLEVLEKCL